MPLQQLQEDLLTKTVPSVITVLVLGFFGILWNGYRDTESRIGSLSGHVAGERIAFDKKIADLYKAIEIQDRKFSLETERLNKEIQYVENLSINGPGELPADG